MKDSTTVEVTLEAREAADTAINAMPREQRPTVKKFSSEAIIEKAMRCGKRRRNASHPTAARKP